jgi:hypothetical protein
LLRNADNYSRAQIDGIPIAASPSNIFNKQHFQPLASNLQPETRNPKRET